MRVLLAITLLLYSSNLFACPENADASMDGELFDIILEYLPQTWEAWIGIIVIASAILSAILPYPTAKTHPFWRVCHTVIRCLGMNAGKFRNGRRMRVISSLGTFFRRKK